MVRVKADLGTRLAQGGKRGCLSRERAGLVEATTHLGESEPPGILGREDSPREHHVPGGALPEEAAHPVERPVVHHEPESSHRHREAGLGSDDAQVAGHGELHTQTHTRALDSGKRGDGSGREPREHLREASGESDVLQLGEISASAEVATRTREDQRPASVSERRRDRTIELLEHVVVDRVAALRPLDGDGGDVVLRGDNNGHGLDSSPRVRIVTEHLTVYAVPGPGAEDVLVADGGRVWTGTDDGAIHVLDSISGEVRTVAQTGGRPLGLEWLPDGRMLVCDAERGLLALDVATAEIEVLTSAVDGVPLLFTNNAAVQRDGTVWFSDSSRRWGVSGWKSDLIEHTRSGRLIRRRPDGDLTVVLDGLAFANGVALAGDESAVFVAETALRRIQRVDLRGGQVRGSTIWVERLDGYPDNIALGTDGLVWVAIASPADPTLSLLQRSPRQVRSLARRLPDALTPQPQRTVRVAAYDIDGTLVHDLTLDASQWHMATGVREHDGTLWLGSLEEPAIARAQVPTRS